MGDCILLKRILHDRADETAIEPQPTKETCMVEMTSYAGASKNAIHFHYDINNEFFTLWLDESLTYSCALWAGAETLEAAQTSKLDHHIGRARASGAGRVLDIGCGWGSTLRRLVEIHGVGQAVGLTLSEEQARWITRNKDPRIECHLVNWFDHRPEEPYDAIVSIEALEHFARFGQSRDQKVAAYREFFARCSSLLKPGGWMSLQTSTYGTLSQADPFIRERIWPESDLPRVSEIVEAADGLLEVVELDNRREDYSRTCSEWARRLSARREEATALVGAAKVEDFERYLKMSAKAFRVGAFYLIRLTLRKLDAHSL